MNRPAIFGTIFAIVVTFAVATSITSGQDQNVIAAIKSGLNKPENFKTVHSFVVGDSDNAKWRKIPWLNDLWEARIEAQKQNKPLFIWAMNGDPLGCV